MDFQQIAFPGEETSYIFVDERSLTQLTRSLAEKIIAEEKSINRLIPLAKGGWTVARSLFGYLQRPLGLQEPVTIGIGSYEGIGAQTEAGPNLYQRISPELEKVLQNETVLVIDDLTDTGEQLSFVHDYLQQLGVKRVVSAALFKKPTSTANIQYWASTTTAWIIFSYEAIETMEELYGIWQQKGLDEETIQSRFKKLGFQQADIDYFWKHNLALQ